MSKRKRKDVSLTPMDPKEPNKGLTDKELKEKYGKEENPDFNRILKETDRRSVDRKTITKPFTPVRKEGK